MKTSPVPARSGALRHSYFNVSWNPSGPRWRAPLGTRCLPGVAATNVMTRAGRGAAVPVAPADLLSSMDLDNMDDTGMYVWAGVLTVAFLVVSWFVAVAWQRWRAAQKEE